MISEAALALAGPDAHLVARPAGVAHVYVGPLTPSGYAPRRSRPVCRALTRQLRTLPGHERKSSLDPSSVGFRRVCARCSARLSSTGRRAEPTCTHRTDYLARYGDLDWRDFFAQVVMAETLTELEHAAHLALLVLGHKVCDQPFPVTHEQADVPGRFLNELIGNRRERLAGFPNRHRSEALQAYIDTGYAHAKAERITAWKERHGFAPRT